MTIGFTRQLGAHASGVQLGIPGGVSVRSGSAGGGSSGGGSLSPPIVSIAALSASKPEGNSGVTEFTFVVTRSSGIGATYIDWACGYGDDQANAADFEGGILPSGTIYFADGETSHIIVASAQGDTDVEPDEEFTVTLFNPVNAVLGTATATGTILNDDLVAWLITSPDPESARQGQIFGGWADLPLTAGFVPGAYYLGGTSIISDGAQGRFIAGYGLENENLRGLASTDGGATWTSLVNGVNVSWGEGGVQFGDYLLGRYVVVIDEAPFPDYIQASATPDGGWYPIGPPPQVEIEVEINLRLFGNVCLHKGQAYVACLSSAPFSGKLFVFKAAELSTDSWERVLLDWDSDMREHPMLASDGARLMLVSRDGYARYSDDDGASWSTEVLIETDGWWATNLVCGNGYFVFIAGPDIWFAPTGGASEFVKYTPAITVAGFTRFTALDFDGSRFLAVGDSDGSAGPSAVITFTGPTDFTPVDIGYTDGRPLESVAYLG
jgi:hypothetical protein